MDEKNLLTSCSFCGKSRNDVEKLLSGPSVYICDECIKLCYKIITNKQKAEEPKSEEPISIAGGIHLPSPKEINAFMDKYVIGQGDAKKILSVAIYNHYKKLYYQKSKNNDVELDKSNILLIGPTGSGKTFLVETLARMLNIPFAIADATNLTETGYVGDDVETIIQKLLRNCDCDVKKAETGIIYIDEIDKLSGYRGETAVKNHTFDEGVQQDLLKLIEGTMATVPLRGRHKSDKYDNVCVNTKNILFICGGAFAGIEKIIKARTEKHGIGFAAEIYGEKDKKQLGELLRQIKPEDLVNYGLIPELIGRIPIIAVFDEIEEADMVRILTEPKNALIKQYQKLFSLDNIDIEFQDDVLKNVAKQALAQKTGARGLRSILERLLLDAMYNLPAQRGQNKIIIDQQFIK